MPNNQMAELLLKADWRAISAYLNANGANSAVDFKARALLRIQTTQGAVDWAVVISDLTRACELEPNEAANWANLCQALLDARRPLEAFEAARGAAQLAPLASGMVEKLMTSAMAAGRQTEALAVFREMQEAVISSGGGVPVAFEQAIEDLESRWWEPLEAGEVRLRRVHYKDEKFLFSLFSDLEFMKQYNLFQECSPEAIRAYIDTAQQPPRISGQIDWIIEELDGTPVGIASFGKIDLINRRALVMFGYPGAGNSWKKTAAAVRIINFAFNQLRLHKILAEVYGYNTIAHKFTLGLGFQQEGVLREHVRLGPNLGWVDLYVNGLLKEDFPAQRFERYMSK